MGSQARTQSTEPPRVLIVGATSAIAKSVARLFAKRGAQFFLVARDLEALQALSQDLVVRGASSSAESTLNFGDTEDQRKVINLAVQSLGTIDVALVAHGSLPDQSACQEDLELTLEELQINGISTVSILTLLGSHFIKQSGGTVAVITSVAGDRGRATNYVYGAAKALVSTFLEGFRGMLHPHGVNVLDIKPGFVDTPMTSHIENKGFLWAGPDQIAISIVKAIDKKRSDIYTPFYWWGIMLIIRNIPTSIFKRLKI